MATILVILSKTPHGSASAKDGLDFAMSATGFGHDVDVVFIDDGVFQLMAPIDSAPAYQTKQPFKIAKSLSFFDIDNVYVCEQSLAKRMIDKETISSEYTVIEAHDIRGMIESHKFVVNL